MKTKPFVCTCAKLAPHLICLVCVGKNTGYTPRTVYKKAEAGEIPSVPISRRHRLFIRETILYWVKNQETGLAA